MWILIAVLFGLSIISTLVILSALVLSSSTAAHEVEDVTSYTDDLSGYMGGKSLAPVRVLID